MADEPTRVGHQQYDPAEDVPECTHEPTQIIFHFEVGGFTEEERDALMGEVIVQGERSELHPSAPVMAVIVK
jgi:hypothetical protein